MTTTKRKKRGLHATGLAAVLAGATAIQLAAAQVSVDVSDCVKLTTPEERLACFEAQVQAAGRAPAGGTAAPATPPPPAAASGAAASGAAAAGSASRGEDDANPPDVLAKVAELRETVPNAYMITLDNGQVWRQTVPEYFPLRVGSDVRIYYSRWRAYRLSSSDRRGYIQVERVR